MERSFSDQSGSGVLELDLKWSGHSVTNQVPVFWRLI